jgi:hypothetical protein
MIAATNDSYLVLAGFRKLHTASPLIVCEAFPCN